MSAWLELDVELGDPVAVGAVSLFPIFSDAPVAPPYLSGPAAEAQAVIEVSELGESATVPELLLHNTGTMPVLLVEGETLIGNKQNRTLNLSVLCPAHADIHLPVSCVEAGRWGSPQASRRSTRHAPQRLRAVKYASVRDSVLGGRGRVSDQGAVWDRVAVYAAERGVDPPTAALEDIFDAASVDRALEQVRPAPGQRGVVIAIGGEVSSCELFDRESTLREYWDGLLAGVALDLGDDEPGACDRQVAEAFLDEVRATPVHRQRGVGLGEEFVLRSNALAGGGLHWEGALVHLAAFRAEVFA